VLCIVGRRVRQLCRPVAAADTRKFTRHDRDCTAPSTFVEQGPELSPAAECWRRVEHARREARSRYRDHLAAVFGRHGVAEPGELAAVALDALTVWRYVDSGERCRCSCHPRLPDSDLHDYGFDCVCTRTPEERRRVFDEWRISIQEFWRSPEGQQIQAAERGADAELEAWLAQRRGVLVRCSFSFSVASDVGHDLRFSTASHDACDQVCLTNRFNS
jgi:hypothetical protein